MDSEDGFNVLAALLIGLLIGSAINLLISLPIAGLLVFVFGWPFLPTLTITWLALFALGLLANK